MITVSGCVIVAIRDDLDDQDIVSLQDQLVEEVSRRSAHGVIIDISSLEIVDTFAGRMLGAMAQMADIMNARTIIVGMRPAVAMTLVELGMTLEGVETALNADKAIAMIMGDRRLKGL
ncbi:STAS domain-containing protein [Fulvimarina sp. MAC8]|uniref:STAS domain-containing protein n=1 Tax=Fulvimarina sp. MAC8 TaxID=3162874 RepID=UPI0032EAC6A2